MKIFNIIKYIVYDPLNYKNMQRYKTQLQVIETSEEIGREAASR